VRRHQAAERPQSRSRANSETGPGALTFVLTLNKFCSTYIANICTTSVQSNFRIALVLSKFWITFVLLNEVWDNIYLFCFYIFGSTKISAIILLIFRRKCLNKIRHLLCGWAKLEN
jgi:hypothetical protein